MTLNWKALAPHRPLAPGSEAYVPPPGGGGAQEIAGWVRAGGTAVLVGGPAGIGKSTELAQAARILQDERVACFVPLDRWENMRRLNPDKLRRRLAARLVEIAGNVLNLPLSTDLFKSFNPGITTEVAEGHAMSSQALLNAAVEEVTRLAHQGRVTFFVDGLEKVPPGADAAELFDVLAELPETVDIVTVVPWHVAFGGGVEFIVRGGERFVALRAVQSAGPEGDVWRGFLVDILCQRLGIGAEAFDLTSIEGEGTDLDEARRHVIERRAMVTHAAAASGGVPRIFLQLMADAATHARLRGEDGWPEMLDLQNAMADMQDSFRRILLAGDTEAINKVHGTDGRELELDRKIRLMAHGILLERPGGIRPVLEIAPLALALVA